VKQVLAGEPASPIEHRITHGRMDHPVVRNTPVLHFDRLAGLL
jgi:hypothetical protein